LPGAISDPAPLGAELSGHAGLPAAVAMRLTRLYGARAAEVAELVRHTPALGAQIDAATHAVAAEIVFAFEAERATTLADCLMRRTMLGLGRDLGAAVAPQALAVARDHLGWDAARASEEKGLFERETAALKVRIGA
jgi:glycerol-3-phosphate dehydrogenase